MKKILNYLFVTLLFISCAGVQTIEKPYYDVYVSGTYGFTLSEDYGGLSPRGILGTIGFLLQVYTVDPKIEVTINVYTDATDDVKKRWVEDVKDKWSNRVCIINYNKSNYKVYPVIVTLYMVPPSEFISQYVDFIHVVSSGVGFRSTTRNWAIDSKNVAGHEVGHFLGNPDEYGWIDDVRQIDNPHNIMCKSAGLPTLKNYNLILEQTKQLIGEDKLKLEFIADR